MTNDPDLTAEQVVFHANERCNQENLIAQLKSGVNSLRGPLNKFVANWALMVMASLAWSLKAWLALSLSSSPECRDDTDVDAEADADANAERNQILRMDFRTFVRNFMLVPAQILYKGRRPPQPDRRARRRPRDGHDRGAVFPRPSSRQSPSQLRPTRHAGDQPARACGCRGVRTWGGAARR